MNPFIGLLASATARPQRSEEAKRTDVRARRLRDKRRFQQSDEAFIGLPASATARPQRSEEA
jgi:hypothetical protein